MTELLTVAEVCARTRLSRRYVYEAIRTGELKAASFGSRRLVRPEALEEWVARAESQSGRKLRAVR